MNVFKNILETVRDGLRRTPPPKFRKLLEDIGGVRIKNMLVCKKPIKKVFDGIINVISLGQWEQAKQELEYDDLFHLYMIITLNNNIDVLLEKNEVLNMEIVDGSRYMGEDVKCIEIPLKGDYYTIEELFDNALRKYGEDRIVQYDGSFNNCQRFITDLLIASDIIEPTRQFEAIKNTELSEYGFTPTSHFGRIGKENEDDKIYQFINQDAITLFNQMPRMTKLITSGATNVAGIFNRVLYGGRSPMEYAMGVNSPLRKSGVNYGVYPRVQSILFGKKWDPLEAFDWMDSKGIKPIKFHETKNYYRFRLIEPEKGKYFSVKGENIKNTDGKHIDDVIFVMIV